MQFEWDENKNESNIRKHGVDFILATEAFDDANHLLIFDGNYGGEDRWSLIGFTSGYALLVVIHTYRDQYGKETTRIISARPATSHERKLYARENG